MNQQVVQTLYIDVHSYEGAFNIRSNLPPMSYVTAVWSSLQGPTGAKI